MGALIFINGSSLSCGEKNADLRLKIFAIRKALAAEAPAFAELLRREMPALLIGDRRVGASIAFGDPDPIAAADAMTSAAASDLKLDRLSMSEQIQVDLAHLGVEYLPVGGAKADSHGES